MIAQRLTAQLLSRASAVSSEEVVDRLLAVQAQDPRAARLSVRSRSRGLDARDVDAALTSRRSLVVTWLNRGTLHLVTAQDYWWLHPLTTPQVGPANRRRLAQEGVSPAQAQRGIEVVADAVGSHGPQTRRQLRLRLAAAGVPTAGQALVHVLLAASLSGRVVRGPVGPAEQAYVAVGEWLGVSPDPMERPEGLARLARRYLRGHGPADARDLAKWAGLSLGDARLGLQGIADEVIPGPGDLFTLGELEPVAPLPGPRLLGAFDPLLLGWVSRRPFVGEHQSVVTTNGIFRPVALVEGRVVATWSQRGAALTLRLLEPVTSTALAILREDASDVVRFLGLPGVATVDLVT
jgi:hypothetical protein